MLSSQFKGLSSFVVALFAMGVGINAILPPQKKQGRKDPALKN
ncbi:hypothetical protein Desti_1432 [Desulfomonile tiedjei DSM 6799]|uniref:Uncharacterized protein n=1 Tax=Desulfomonile tiedjei (strain ATCC 49306 / DSM 6799 / DCB-1) TaxID=706587 RepID=I4C3K3_DESTA|nr:hypothetical protein Desti_1432 [Desulfomonile tiedjei DSM 6799]